MKLLLDTHIFVWSALEPHRVAPAVIQALDEPENELWLSPITSWECLLLAQRKKIQLDPDPVTWLRHNLLRLSPKEAPINHEVAIHSRTIDLPHSDPADRFLAATAVVFELTLVTADRRLIHANRCDALPSLP
ncbi:MAG TPA: type II toxin-antitoxin system VapC family toxin [Kofleriaceae bacterium]|nr:type II toxin-antitoxin system VapC family toxin [Kofleriaceae bacterium]